eukprot:974723-Prymnesium_polylepis.1
MIRKGRALLHARAHIHHFLARRAVQHSLLKEETDTSCEGHAADDDQSFLRLRHRSPVVKARRRSPRARRSRVFVP